jgi:hypothetical protein
MAIFTDYERSDRSQFWRSPQSRRGMAISCPIVQITRLHGSDRFDRVHEEETRLPYSRYRSGGRPVVEDRGPRLQLQEVDVHGLELDQSRLSRPDSPSSLAGSQPDQLRVDSVAGRSDRGTKLWEPTVREETFSLDERLFRSLHSPELPSKNTISRNADPPAGPPAQVTRTSGSSFRWTAC